MADNVTFQTTAVASPPNATVVATDNIAGIDYQRVKVVWGPDGTVNDADVASGKPFPIQLRVSDGTAWTYGAGTVGTGTPRITLGSDDPAVAVLGATGDAASATTTIKAALRGIATAVGTTAWDLGSGTGGTRTQRTIIDSSQLAAAQSTAQARSATFQLVDQPTDGTLVTKGLSNKSFSAAFTTLTRPANTTAYTALDSISDNATAGSVTALTATVSDTNDDPIFISEILINSTDTGLAGKRVRAYLFNSNPTTSSGVVNGDNAAYSQKKAGYIGSFSGVLETGFSDGTVGRLVPSYADGAAASTAHAMAGGYVVTVPTSGAKTLFIQYQAVDGFTPSANSTTIIGTARGWQGRAG